VAADDPHNDKVPGPAYLTTEELRRDVSALREILQARLDGMDRATIVLSETVNRTPTAIQLAVGHLQELHDEKFQGIALQFSERDTRTEQAAKASKEALDAALLAAKELVSQQNEANAAAADKAEQSTIKQIDQIGIRIDTMQKALDDRLTELKERIDRGEGTTAGTATYRSERRLDMGQVIAVVAVIVAVAAVVFSAVHK
jgi:DNA anti-recombination protein RmuC